jgi:hypothetical protein
MVHSFAVIHGLLDEVKVLLVKIGDDLDRLSEKCFLERVVERSTLPQEKQRTGMIILSRYCRR